MDDERSVEREITLPVPPEEAWDLVIGGIEIAPAYSELVDPVEQRRRLMAQAAAASRGENRNAA